MEDNLRTWKSQKIKLVWLGDLPKLKVNINPVCLCLAYSINQ
jgi:hypothetical protein